MASDVLPCPLDIHSGGIDLRFPHHDNEIAQCEAYYDCQQWVNYFLHTGHLHINGRKMSRSLKNFITIKEILQQYSPRHLRMFFLLHKWDGMINYSETSLQESISKEKQFHEFLMNTCALLRDLSINSNQKLTSNDRELLAALDFCQNKIHEALCDNLSTDKAIDELSALVTRANIYLDIEPRYLVISRIREYVLKILGIFGLEYDNQTSETSIEPIMNILSEYRDKIRVAAKDQDFKEIFKLSDEIRDKSLPKLGIIIEDRAGAESRWKTACPKEIAIEMERKSKEEQKAKEIAETKKLAAEKKKAEKEAQNKIKAEEMFLGNSKYSAWDDRGIPTNLADGNKLSKSEAKKLEKAWEKQKKLNENN